MTAPEESPEVPHDEDLDKNYTPIPVDEFPSMDDFDGSLIHDLGAPA